MTPILGIDISKWQGVSGMSEGRFDACHRAGIRFAVMRASVRTDADPSLTANVRRARARGWEVVGAYHFLYHGSIREQAAVFARRVGDLLPFLDVEAKGVTLTDVREFVARFRELRPDRPIGCYTAEGPWRSLTGNADGAAIFTGPLWDARWTERGNLADATLPATGPRPAYGGWREAALWQFGVLGVGRDVVDCDAFYGTQAELRELATGRPTAPPLEERPRYAVGYNAMVDAARAAVEAAVPAVEVPGPAWPKGRDDARADLLDAVGNLRMAEVPRGV